MSVLSKKVTPGLFITEEMLEQAGIEGEVEIEILDHLIKIYSSARLEKTKTLNRDSPVWDNVRMEGPHD